MEKFFELREQKSQRLILRGTMAQIDHWLEIFQEKDVVYEIWPCFKKMSSNVTKCH